MLIFFNAVQEECSNRPVWWGGGEDRLGVLDSGSSWPGPLGLAEEKLRSASFEFSTGSRKSS